MGALARHQSAIIGRQVVRGSIFRRTPAKPYGRPPVEGTTSAVRPMGAKGRPLNVTRATNYCAIPLHPKMLIKWLLDCNSASQQDHENSYYRLDYYNLPKISNCIISPFLVYPEVKQTHESSQTRAI
ncbi:hypothetical protein HZH68_011449 [Vespula germanica]|uniref:Uncharacterized protein n=1 Tax=Vespula germanica TaxID=30212 RepID=A0A834JUR6_VESGE|nr:hypothetical protein HZH68_011449 [Vespula germanica]